MGETESTRYTRLPLACLCSCSRPLALSLWQLTRFAWTQWAREQQRTEQRDKKLQARAQAMSPPFQPNATSPRRSASPLRDAVARQRQRSAAALDAAQNGGRNGESDHQLLRKVRNCMRAAACESSIGRLGLVTVAVTV